MFQKIPSFGSRIQTQQIVMTQVKDNDDPIIIEQSFIIYLYIEAIQHSKVMHIDTKSDHRFKVTPSTQRFRHVICDPAVMRA